MATVGAVSKYKTEYKTDAQLAYPDEGNNSRGSLVDPVDLTDPVVPVVPDAPPSTCDATGKRTNSAPSGPTPSLISDTSSRESTNSGGSYGLGSGGGHTYEPGEGPESVPRTVPDALRGIGSRFEEAWAQNSRDGKKDNK